VVALRQAGLSTGEIAERVGISREGVVAAEHSAARSRARRMSGETGRTVVFPDALLARLDPHAARRGIHRNSLARRIVETVVDENMVDAVLDDAEET